MAIVQHFGVVVDLARVKSMQVIELPAFKYQLSIQLNSRLAYIFNPGTNQWEIQLFNDVVNIEYRDYDLAIAYLSEWMEIWRNYQSSDIVL